MQMPPRDSKKPPLTPTQVELLRQWINAGAKYEPHWAYIPPQRPPVPDGEATPWPRNDDRSLPPRTARSAPASRRRPRPIARTLVRRLYFDLTGLPPTPAEHRRIRRRQAARRLRAAGRPAARVARVRRADGDVVVRPGAVRRHRRLPRRPGPPHHAVSRLRHQVVQRQPAVRPVHDRAAGRRPAAESDDVAARRHAATTACCRRRTKAAPRTPSTGPSYLADRVRNFSEAWLAALDGLRRVPRPQVRPVHAGRLLQPGGVLRRRRPLRLVRAGRRQHDCPRERPPEMLAWTLPVYDEMQEARRADRQARSSRSPARSRATGRSAATS